MSPETFIDLITISILGYGAAHIVRLACLRPLIRWQISKWCRENDLEFVSMEILGAASGPIRLRGEEVLPKTIGRILIELKRKGSADLHVSYASWRPGWYPRLEFSHHGVDEIAGTQVIQAEQDKGDSHW